MEENTEKAGRIFLYELINFIEDSLVDSHNSHKAIPQFADIPKLGTVLEQNPAVIQPNLGFMLPKDDSLEKISNDIRLCRACRLYAGRKNTVPGFGPIKPVVMVLGEAPGAEEDASGLPFVGAAGKLLDKMLSAIGLSRENNCFIGNIVKCRPPHNRDPAPDEQAACMPFLERQIALLDPKAFLTIGRIPGQALLNTKDSLGSLRGKVYDFRGRPLVASYHPSALLRDESYKRPAWEDLKLLKSMLDKLGK
ncbi:hypothetical protein MASR2M29_04970 [Spirochaetota bacterium]